MKRREKWPLPARVEASALLQRTEALQRWAKTEEGRRELRAYLLHFRAARDTYRHNARECARTVEAIEAVLGEVEA